MQNPDPGACYSVTGIGTAGVVHFEDQVFCIPDDYEPDSIPFQVFFPIIAYSKIKPGEWSYVIVVEYLPKDSIPGSHGNSEDEFLHDLYEGEEELIALLKKRLKLEKHFKDAKIHDRDKPSAPGNYKDQKRHPSLFYVVKNAEPSQMALSQIRESYLFDDEFLKSIEDTCCFKKAYLRCRQRANDLIVQKEMLRARENQLHESLKEDKEKILRLNPVAEAYLRRNDFWNGVFGTHGEWANINPSRWEKIGSSQPLIYNFSPQKQNQFNRSVIITGLIKGKSWSTICEEYEEKFIKTSQDPDNKWNVNEGIKERLRDDILKGDELERLGKVLDLYLSKNNPMWKSNPNEWDQQTRERVKQILIRGSDTALTPEETRAVAQYNGLNIDRELEEIKTQHENLTKQLEEAIENFKKETEKCLKTDWLSPAIELVEILEKGRYATTTDHGKKEVNEAFKRIVNDLESFDGYDAFKKSGLENCPFENLLKKLVKSEKNLKSQPSYASDLQDKHEQWQIDQERGN